MKTAWTPAPWVAQQGDDNEGTVATEDIWGTVTADGYHLARIWNDFSDAKNGQEAEANAHLIAAAPDLYDALYNLLGTSKALHSRLDKAGWLSVTEAENALAKARGEQHFEEP